MKKKLIIDERAQRELNKFTETIQDTFGEYFRTLGKEGKLEPPDAKKISNNLYEIRISLENQYRGMYAYIGTKYIVIVHVFQKKTQKTPMKNKNTALKRIKEYE